MFCFCSVKCVIASLFNVGTHLALNMVEDHVWRQQKLHALVCTVPGLPGKVLYPDKISVTSPGITVQSLEFVIIIIRRNVGDYAGLHHHKRNVADNTHSLYPGCGEEPCLWPASPCGPEEGQSRYLSATGRAGQPTFTSVPLAEQDAPHLPQCHWQAGQPTFTSVPLAEQDAPHLPQCHSASMMPHIYLSDTGQAGRPTFTSVPLGKQDAPHLPQCHSPSRTPHIYLSATGQAWRPTFTSVPLGKQDAPHLPQCHSASRMPHIYLSATGRA
ncbi:hypothetical protein NDU88_005881 [Pleurodeles waltl]|uniref:Uncharacterized protein n=1 Tax=Pleurodeles waltl TaxID=8319 RepID=A0AAV7L258_PLEWA|nr:hypothetical protein NDU88_005881 [Pleurodeles waltl]